MATVTQTTNFIYTYDDTLSTADQTAAIARANALAASCETDLTTLQGWFSVSGGLGSSNQITVIITKSIAGLGWNGGYQTSGKTQIKILPFTGATSADAAARAVFVAEMSEVLMSYRNQQTGNPTWIENNSMGEALSTVSEALLHPEGYYTATVGSPRITSWLNSNPRPNWIDKNESTDKDFVSFGCGIVFIYYLRDQLGYSIGDIITKAGTTLEATYKNLTGNTGGFTALTDFLDLYLPEGTPYGPVSDDLFPLPVLTSLTFSATSVVCGNTSIATIALDHAYAAGPLTVSLLCADIGFASVPQTVTIPTGAASANFIVTTPSIGIPFQPAQVQVLATLGGSSVGATLMVLPSVVAGTLKALTLFPDNVVGGNSSTGTVTLEEAVPTDTLVGLAAVESGGHLPLPGQGSSVVRVPSSITIAAGRTTGSFRIQSSVLSPPTLTRTATIMAGAVTTKYGQLTVER